MNRKKSFIPFVNLHSHTCMSMFDGLGYPEEHLRTAWGNGMDAMAITDHGHCNGLVYQVLAAKKMEKEGKKIKPIFGSEVYFIPSVSDWEKDYEKIQSEKKKKTKKEEVNATILEDEEASKKAIKNILNRRCHLVLLAQNQKGLNNLFKLISTSYKGRNFYRFPRIDYEMLQKHNEGIIASSACLGGFFGSIYWQNIDEGGNKVWEVLCKETEKMLSIFGKDRWLGEVQWNNVNGQHEVNKLAIKLSEKYGFKLISTVDSHYPTPNLWKDREIYKRLGWLGKATAKPGWMQKELPSSVNEMGYELFIKNGDQVWESYKKYSKICNQEYEDSVIRKSIENSYHIAHKLIEEFYPDNTVRLPNFVVEQEGKENYQLAKLALEGLKKLGLDGKKEYVERLKEELYVIKDRGFSKYFLTMKAIIDEAKLEMLSGTARGSAAGSLLSYVLNITEIDPIRWNLQFERFLRSDAVDFPDIDTDWESPMELKEKLIGKWGENSVVPVSNVNTLQLKSLIKDVSKFYNIPFQEVNQVTSKMMFEATPEAKKKRGITAGVYTPTFEELKEYSPTLQNFLQKYPKIAEHIDVLYGMPRSLSRHAGACVIGENLDKWLPLINSGGIMQTPWSEGQNVRHLEPMGFIKFDLLGLASLRMISTAIRHILKRNDSLFANREPKFEDIKEYYNKHLHPDLINFDDKNVWENIFDKIDRAPGIFQMTESGVQNFCKSVKPRSLMDLTTITSIYRPGPLSSKIHDRYLSAKEDPSQVKYIHAIEEEVLKETHFLIFQEQLAEMVHKLGKDISLDEGNQLRKMLIKKGIGEVEEKKNKIWEKFLAGCKEKGISRFDASDLWERMEFFAGYSFNKSHALSYSAISFQCAWLWNYYPVEWLAAFLDKEPDAKKEKAINMAKSAGFTIIPIDINKSGKVWDISEDGKTLIQPLTSIKGLGDTAIDQVLQNRPFNKIEDLIFSDKIVKSKLNVRALGILVKSGALNNLIDERFNNLNHFYLSLTQNRPLTQKKFEEQIKLYSNEPDFDEMEKIEFISGLTGIFPIEKVLTESVVDRICDEYIPPISEYDPELLRAWVIPREVIVKKTRKGKNYYIVHCTDINSVSTSIRCWGVDRKKDRIYLNRVYSVCLQYDPQWGFSTRGRVGTNWRMLG